MTGTQPGLSRCAVTDCRYSPSGCTTSLQSYSSLSTSPTMSATRASVLVNAFRTFNRFERSTLFNARAFATSAQRAQAVPQPKPVLNKEFKIYRWVSSHYFELQEDNNTFISFRTQMSHQRNQLCSRTPSTSMPVDLWSVDSVDPPLSPCPPNYFLLDSRCTYQNKERSRSYTHIPSLLSRGYLWFMRHEHRRTKHTGVPVPY